MSTHKHFDRICCGILAVILVITCLFINGEALGIEISAGAIGYENRIFDTSRVHSIDIVADGWEEFLETCTNEEYIECSAVIDGEAYKNIAIRAKGNTSLSSVKSYDSDRYSFKIEFDHYDSSITYHGLDKLCLNNIIQDNTFLKDYITYEMMRYAGAASPLCSFVYITVNGEDWGLYLAVEGVEDSFLQRNYGSDYGELYKPDSMSFGGGRGNGKDFDMDNFISENGGNESDTDSAAKDNIEAENRGFGGKPQGGFPNMENFNLEDIELPEGIEASDITEAMENPEKMQELAESFKQNMGGGKGGFDGGMGSDDVKLQYIDDNADSYSNIFSSAKTDVTETDEQRLIASLKALSEGNVTESVDVESTIKYFVVHNFVCNGDSYTGSMIHNYYLYEKDGLLSMLPWDYNLAFGGFNSSSATDTVNTAIDTPVSGGIGEDRPMVSWIFQNSEYTAIYHEYFSNFISEYFESGFFAEEIDRVTALIAPYVEKDPTKFCTYEEFQKGAETLKEFCLLRAESVRGQLDGTIPSVTDEQNGSSALIDASHITISDMGSMGHGGGMGDKENRGFDRRQSLAEGVMEGEELKFPAFSSSETMEKLSVEAIDGNAPPEIPQNGAMPDMSGAEPPAGENNAEMPDMSGAEPPAGENNAEMPDMGGAEPPMRENNAEMPDMGGIEPPTGENNAEMPDMGGTEPPTGENNAEMPDMGGAEPPTGENNAEMPDMSGMRPSQFGGNSEDSANAGSENHNPAQSGRENSMQDYTGGNGSADSAVLLAVSIGVLAIGILIAALYKR